MSKEGEDCEITVTTPELSQTPGVEKGRKTRCRKAATMRVLVGVDSVPVDVLMQVLV